MFAVSECRLNLRQAGSALNGMRTMRVSQPVRGYRSIYACLRCCTLHHAVNGSLCEPAATFSAREHGIIGASITAQ
jgi:hypothetical protein